MSDELTLDPTAELDLTNAGLQPTRVDWIVTSTIMKRTKKDNGDMAVVEFEALEPVDDIPNFKATAWFVLKHETASVAKGGQAQLKKLFIAILGTPKSSLAALDGQRVNAEVKEDDDGFRKIGNYRTYETVDTEVPAIAV